MRMAPWLAAIRLTTGACQLILRPFSIEQAVQTISIIKSSGRRLLQLINDILDAAKMKQGELVIKHDKVNIRSLISDVFDLTQTPVTKPFS